jgi:lysophospholipase L1-like esterase
MNYRRHRLLFVLAAAVLFFGAAESAIRITKADKAREEKFYDDIFDPLTRMIPGAVNPYTAVVDHMNSRGLRGPDFRKEKAPGVFRIVCLGDSTTFGMGDFGNSYPKVLGELLNEGLPAKRFEVINAGIPGTSLYQQRLHFESLFEGSNPDMVILMTGPNYRKELKLFRDKMQTPFFRALLGTQRLMKHSAVYRFLRLRLKGTPSTRVKDDSEMSPTEDLPAAVVRADYLEDLEIFHALAEKWGFRLVFMPSISRDYIRQLQIMGLRPDREDYESRAARANSDQEFYFVAEKWKLPVVDFSRDFVPYDMDTPGLWFDPGHPGNLGNRLIAQRVVTELRRKRLIPES